MKKLKIKANRYILVPPLGYELKLPIYKDEENKVRSFVVGMIGEDKEGLVSVAISTYKEIRANLKANGFTFQSTNKILNKKDDKRTDRKN